MIYRVVTEYVAKWTVYIDVVADDEDHASDTAADIVEELVPIVVSPEDSRMGAAVSCVLTSTDADGHSVRVLREEEA
jgi:hypothetical protein